MKGEYNMKLCVALDLKEYTENINLAKKIKNHDVWLKVGLRSYIRDGKKIIDELKNINPNFKIFLDLKLYDIPNTMADSAEVIAGLGVDMFNIHASAGKVAMQTVMHRLRELDNRPTVLSVTALTSFENENFRAIYGDEIDHKAQQFAKDSYNAGIDGVVCSVYESLAIKDETNLNFITLTPGIRPFGEDNNDQKRVADIQTARDNLSDFIVVGRPIYQNNQPEDVVTKILEEI
jgi:orotidine-5'-phosphate decarboxylase